MKKLKSIFVLFTMLVLHATYAQARKVKETAPLFNPVTHCQLRYYYYPNLEAYYDTQKSIYYFKADGEWQTAEEIPTGYRGYSMYNKYSVFITDYDDDNICQFIAIHKKKYPYITNEKSKKLTVLTE
jgi:hypothetical protein